MDIYIFLLILLIINFVIFNLNNFISNKLKLYDSPDFKRKIHLNKTPLTGGIFIFVNFILFLLILKFSDNLNTLFTSKRELFSLVFLIFSLFSLGLYDDKYNLGSIKKLFLSGLFIFISVVINENLILTRLNFITNNYNIELYKLSIFFTILSILLFLNALNMFDGIDLQVSSYCILLFFYFMFRFNLELLIFLIPVMIFIVYYNFKKKLFLGDSGTNILAGIISFLMIKFYNINSNFYCEEIFLIMLIPGIDMLRLFLVRIIKGKNPFLPDNSHIHHVYLRKFNQRVTFLIIQLQIFIPIIIYHFFDINIVIIISLSIVFYLMIITFIKIYKYS